MKLKGKRTTFQSSYDSELGCFTDSYMLQCKGGGGTQTTTTGPSPEQRAILNKQLGYANKMEGLGPMDFYEGDTTAGMSSDTEAGLEAQLAAAGDTGALSNTAMARFQDAMAYDPMNDPNTEKFLDAVTNPLISKYETQIAPKLSSAAVKGGAFGGDRAAIQQERAISDLTGQVTKIYVSEGDTVQKGDQLLTLSAMKMESIVLSSRHGVIKKIHIYLIQRIMSLVKAMTCPEKNASEIHLQWFLTTNCLQLVIIL